MAAFEVDALLAPVPGPSPAGAYLRDLPVYDEIKNARKVAEADPTELAPWKKLAELVAKALTQSKDLQLAIWLLEPAARLDGFRGVAAGLVVLRRLLLEYWDALHPPIDPDDEDPLAFRKALLNWVDEKLPEIIKVIPLTAPPASFALLHYEVTLKTGEAKKALMVDGWPSTERFEEALQNSTLKYLESVLEDLMNCEAERAALQAVAEPRFSAAGHAGDPVTFLFLKETLDTSRWLVERPAKKKREAQMPGAPALSATGLDPVDPAYAASVGRNGDEIWSQALDLTRGSRVDGLRMMQDRLATAVGGRDRFLRQLQLAELCLEGGVHTLAYPIFDDLAKTIDGRKLEEWEDKVLIARVWKGLVQCCGLVEHYIASAGPRKQEIVDRLTRLDANVS